jgi:hypothetical protein
MVPEAQVETRKDSQTTRLSSLPGDQQRLQPVDG